jgi:hypothetical protein
MVIYIGQKLVFSGGIGSIYFIEKIRIWSFMIIRMTSGHSLFGDIGKRSSPKKLKILVLQTPLVIMSVLGGGIIVRLNTFIGYLWSKD